MRYLGLAESFIIAEEVTGIDAMDLVRVTRIELLDSALHAPRAGFEETDLYPTLIEKAAVLCIHLAMNHPLPDGNKRLAWMAMVIFLEMNEVELHVDEDDAVQIMLSIAAGETTVHSLTKWLEMRIQSL